MRSRPLQLATPVVENWIPHVRLPASDVLLPAYRLLAADMANIAAKGRAAKRKNTIMKYDAGIRKLEARL